MTTFEELNDAEVEGALERYKAATGPEREQIGQSLSRWREKTRLAMDTQKTQRIETLYSGLAAARSEFSSIPLLEATADLDETVAGGVNQGLVADEWGKSLDEVSSVWPQYRSAYALATFQKDVKTDKELYGLISGRVQQKKAQREFADNLRGASVVHAFEDLAGGTFSSPVERVKQEIAKNPEAFKGMDEAEVLAKYSKAYSALRSEFAPYQGMAKRAFEYLSSWTGSEAPKPGDEKTRADIENLAMGFIEMKPDDRQNVYEIVALAAKAKGAGDSKDFWQKLGESFARGATGMFDDTAIMLRDSETRNNISLLKDPSVKLVVWQNGRIDTEETANMALVDAGRWGQTFREVQDGERESLLLQNDESLKQTQVLRELKALASGEVDPIRPGASGIMGQLEGGVYGAAESVPYTLLSGVPYVGPVLTYTALAASDYNRLMRENPEMDSGAAMTLSMLTAAPQAALERVQFGLLTGKAPGFSQALKRLADARTPIAIRIAAGIAGTVAAENVTEGLQDAVPVISDTLAAAIRKDMPNFDPEKAWGDWKGTRADTFFAVLPLSLIGGGALTVRELRRTGGFLQFKQELRIGGFSEKAAEAIAAETNPDRQTELIREGWDKRTPEDISEGQRIFEATKNASTETQGSADMPTMDAVRDGNGNATYIVKDETGREIYRTQDAAAADQAFIDEVRAVNERRLFEEKQAMEGDEGQIASGQERLAKELLFSKSSARQEWLTAIGDRAMKMSDELPDFATEAEARRAVADANSAADGGGFQAAAPDEVARLRESPGMGAAIRLSAVFGRRIVVFRNESKPWINGFVNSRQPEVIYLNADSSRPFHAVAGHELWEHLRIDQPDLAQSTWEALAPDLRNWEKYKAARKADGYSDTDIPHELIGDFLGDSVSDPDFWDKLNKRNPTLFQKFAMAVKEWLDGIVDAVKRAGFGTDEFFNDIERAQSILADSIAQFSAKDKARAQQYEPGDLNQNFYSGSRSDYIASIESAFNSAQKNPEQRLALFERARKKLVSMMGEDQTVIAAMEYSREASQQEREAVGMPKAERHEINREKLLRAIGELDALLSVFPPEIRGKVGGFATLTKIGNGEKAMTDFFVKRIEMIDEELERALKREYDAKLQRLFKRAQPKKDEAGKKRVGKAGADVHALFDVLRDAVGWNADEVAAHIAGLETQITSGEMTPEQEAHAQLEIGLVALVGDWKNADAERRAVAVKSATETFDRGYIAFKFEKLNERERREEIRKELRRDTGKAGTKDERDERAAKDNGLLGGWKDSLLSLLNFEQAAKWVFGENSQQAQRIADMEREASHKKEDGIQSKMDALEDLFTDIAGSRLKGEQLRWNLSQKSITAGGKLQADGSKSGAIILSELEAITATLMWRQEDGRRHMKGRLDENGRVISPWSYDQDFIDEIEAALSPEARAVRSHLIEQYNAEYATLNPVYKKLNGISMPKNRNYSPLTVKPQQAQGGQTIDPVTGASFSAGSTTPGSLRTRGTSVAEPDFRDAVQTFIAHTKQMEHWKAYAPFVNEAGAILGNREVGNSVEAKAGKEAVSVLRGWLDMFAQGGTRDAAAHLALTQGLSNISNRAASIALVGRLGTLAIQSTQLGAALAEMPVSSYTSRLGKLFAGQLGWGEAFKSSYIQRRFNEMPPVVRQAVEGLKADKPNALRHAVANLGRLIGGADALFTAGTYAIVYDYQISQAGKLGLSGTEAEAFARQAAERSVDRVAQPTRQGTRSLFENTSTHPLARLAWAFASESRKNLGLAAYAMANKTWPEKARVIAYVWIINGIMATVIRSAWKDARDDDDEEVFDSENWDLKRMALSVATEPFYGLPAIGSMIQAGAFKAAGEYLPEGNLFSSGSRAVKPVSRIPELLTGQLETEEAIRDVEAMLSGFGLLNSNIAAAASLSHLARDLYGVTDNAIPDDQ